MDEAGPVALGALLREHRERRRLTQEELAERAGSGVGVSTISNVERGRTRPYRHTLEALCRALGLDTAERAALLAAWRAQPDHTSIPARPVPAASVALAPSPDVAVPLTPLIGREHEEAAVAHLLRQDDVRLLTLTGPGGVGKTRLAQQVAVGQSADFRDGVVTVALAPLRDPRLVLPTVAQALGFRDAGEQLQAQRLADGLRTKELLLVLDNCEQVADAAPELAALLGACPGLKVLATSRAALRVRGEQEFAVPPLALPERPPEANLAVLCQAPSVALFVRRVQAVRPDFVLTPDNAATVAAICRRLDGLPLALELAAARVKLLPPAALLARLERSLEVLAGGGRDLPARHQALRDTLAWSYELLDAPEQALFRGLAVFAGGCTLEAAVAVCCETPSSHADDALAAMDGLVNQSLVQLDEVDGEPRLVMLETIRDYAAEQLVARGEEAAARRRHAAYFMGLVEEAEPALLGPDQVMWLARLERERDNLRAALRWAQGDGDTELGLRLAGGLWRFWHVHGYLSEGVRWLDAFLAQDSADEGCVPRAARAKALRSAGGLAFFRGDYERAWAFYEGSWRLYDALGDEENRAGALHNLALVTSARGEGERAWTLYEEALALARRLENGESLIASTLGNMGDLARQQGDYARARQMLEESLAARRRRGDTMSTAVTLVDLAILLRVEGDEDEALARYREGLALCSATGYVRPVVQCLEGIAAIAVNRGRPELAVRLAGAAEALRQETGMPLEYDERADFEKTVQATRAALGDDTFAAARARGQALSPEQAMAEACSD